MGFVPAQCRGHRAAGFGPQWGCCEQPWAPTSWCAQSSPSAPILCCQRCPPGREAGLAESRPHSRTRCPPAVLHPPSCWWWPPLLPAALGPSLSPGSAAPGGLAKWTASTNQARLAGPAPSSGCPVPLAGFISIIVWGDPNEVGALSEPDTLQDICTRDSIPTRPSLACAHSTRTHT